MMHRQGKHEINIPLITIILTRFRVILEDEFLLKAKKNKEAEEGVLLVDI